MKEVLGTVCSVLHYQPQNCSYLMFSKGLPIVFHEILHIWGNILPTGEMSIRGDARKNTIFIVILKMDKCLNKLE